MVPVAQLLHNLFDRVLFTLHLNPHSLRNVRYQPCTQTSSKETQMLAVDGRCGLAALMSPCLCPSTSLGHPAGLNS